MIFEARFSLYETWLCGLVAVLASHGMWWESLALSVVGYAVGKLLEYACEEEEDDL